MRRSLKTGDWTAEETIDPDSSKDLILLNPPAGPGAEPAFHCYLPPQFVQAAATRRLAPPEAVRRAFTAWLGTGWGTLGLLAPANVLWFRDPARFRPFLDAVCQWWAELDGLGPRYSTGSAHPQDLWTVPSNLQYVLVNMGLPAQDLSGPLPSGGIAELRDRTAAWDGMPVVERWD